MRRANRNPPFCARLVMAAGGGGAQPDRSQGRPAVPGTEGPPSSRQLAGGPDAHRGARLSLTVRSSRPEQRRGAACVRRALGRGSRRVWARAACCGGGSEHCAHSTKKQRKQLTAIAPSFPFAPPPLLSLPLARQCIGVGGCACWFLTRSASASPLVWEPDSGRPSHPALLAPPTPCNLPWPRMGPTTKLPPGRHGRAPRETTGRTPSRKKLVGLKSP
ncbi:hypothetical protein BS78_03G244800 [Paspalum vaginatum]|nr:hypothetical protein BS78_03G244800 [Paspalum vaginatum]